MIWSKISLYTKCRWLTIHPKPPDRLVSPWREGINLTPGIESTSIRLPLTKAKESKPLRANFSSCTKVGLTQLASLIQPTPLVRQSITTDISSKGCWEAKTGQLRPPSMVVHMLYRPWTQPSTLSTKSLNWIKTHSFIRLGAVNCHRSPFRIGFWKRGEWWTWSQTWQEPQWRVGVD